MISKNSSIQQNNSSRIMIILNIINIMLENPALIKLKEKYLNHYRKCLHLNTNHQESLPPQNKVFSLSIKQLDQLIKPKLLLKKQLQADLQQILPSITNQFQHTNIYSANFLKQISQLHQRQVEHCEFKQPKKKNASQSLLNDSELFQYPFRSFTVGSNQRRIIYNVNPSKSFNQRAKRIQSIS